jgi:hypothetical protein
MSSVTDGTPTGIQRVPALLTAIAAAFVASAVILMLFVLCAEYPSESTISDLMGPDGAIPARRAGELTSGRFSSKA